MGFDGPELYIKAIRPITKDSQIFISYIDTTFPKRIRQKELQGRYFFTCQCTKCTGADEPPEPTGRPGLVAKTAYGLLKSGFGAAQEKDVDTIMEGLVTFRLPKTEQPFVSVFDELIVREIPDELNHAWLNCAVRSSHIDPVVYSHEAHPLRAVHAWALARVTLQISQEVPGMVFPDFSKRMGEDRDRDREMSFDYGLLAWTLLAELVGNEGKYCTVPGFRKMVKDAFAEVHEEFMMHGVDPRQMRMEVREEWTKLRRIIGNYWQAVLLESS